MEFSACGKALIGIDAKSGKCSYYVCGPLLKKGAGTCAAPFLPKAKFEELVPQKLKGAGLTEDHLGHDPLESAKAFGM